MNLNSPTTARLTPADRQMPGDLAVLRTEIKRGVPRKLDIAPTGLRVVLSVSTGLVRPLLKMAPETVVLASDDQKAARSAAGNTTAALAESRARAAPRLLFIANKKFAGFCPLVTGASVLVPIAGTPASAGTHIWVRSFALTVSALIGKNATGSWVELGWREIDKGSETFDSVVLRRDLIGRVAYSRMVEGELEVVEVATDILSPDTESTENGGGLNWRFMHDVF